MSPINTDIAEDFQEFLLFAGAQITAPAAVRHNVAEVEFAAGSTCGCVYVYSPTCITVDDDSNGLKTFDDFVSARRYLSARYLGSL